MIDGREAIRAEIRACLKVMATVALGYVLGLSAIAAVLLLMVLVAIGHGR